MANFNEDSVNTTIRLPTPSNENMEERLQKIDELKFFLGTAPNDWEASQQVHSFPLSTGESISCVLWNDLFHVTGTDIVRCLLYRFHLFGRPVTNLKKFEEGIFSDLRNLKPGMDASLEEPKSEFLEMLYKNNCIRTQKKQKVFFWFSVPHDRLFLDALERDLKREKLGLEPTSISIAEPATSLSLDTTQELFDQLKKSMSLSAVAITNAIDKNLQEFNQIHTTFTNKTDLFSPIPDDGPTHFSYPENRSTRSVSVSTDPPLATVKQTSYSAGTSPKLAHADSFEMENMERQQKIFGAFSLFEGSPSYKQRQRKRTYSALPFTYDPSVNPQHLFYALREQQLLHQGDECDKSYVCPLPQCARVFKRLEHLKRHFRTHTLERPYSCSMCGKHFSRTDNLAQHKKTHDRKKLCVKQHKPVKQVQPAQDLTPPISDDEVDFSIQPMTYPQEEPQLSWHSSMKTKDYFYDPHIYTW